MRRSPKKMNRLEIAASLTPIAMMLVAWAAPVQGDGEGSPPEMTFDSVGSMLQEMDRERELNAMEHYAAVPRVETGNSKHACETEDVNRRLHQVFEGLQSRIARIDLEEMVRIEQQITERGYQRADIGHKMSEARMKKARLDAKLAAETLRAALIKIEREREQASSADEMALNAAVEAALRAAEAALENAP